MRRLKQQSRRAWPLSDAETGAQAKGAKLVSVASVKGCKLDQLADQCVHLPLERELCPFDLAPVTSTAIQMVFGDTVAIALMQACFPSNPVTDLEWHRMLLKVCLPPPEAHGHAGPVRSAVGQCCACA